MDDTPPVPAPLLGERVRRAREARSMSQAELAAQMAVPPRWIADLENGPAPARGHGGAGPSLPGVSGVCGLSPWAHRPTTYLARARWPARAAGSPHQTPAEGRGMTEPPHDAIWPVLARGDFRERDVTADDSAIVRVNQCRGLWGGGTCKGCKRAAAHDHVCGFCHRDYPQDLVARWCVGGWVGPAPCWQPAGQRAISIRSTAHRNNRRPCGHARDRPSPNYRPRTSAHLGAAAR